MLGKCCSVINIRKGTEYRNPDETEETMASDSPKDVSISDVLTELLRMELRPCSKSTTAWLKNILTPWFKWKVGK